MPKKGMKKPPFGGLLVVKFTLPLEGDEVEVPPHLDGVVVLIEDVLFLGGDGIRKTLVAEGLQAGDFVPLGGLGGAVLGVLGGGHFDGDVHCVTS